MKIASQTDNEMVLKDGNASAMVFGALFAVIGAIGGFYFAASGATVIWISVAIVAGGLATLLFSTSIIVDFDKAGGRMQYQKKSLIGGSTAAYATADILQIETRKMWRMQGGVAARGNVPAPQQVLVSQSVIVFKDGKEVPLDHQKSASSMNVGPAVLAAGQGKEAAIANRVAAFLGVPFQEIAPPGGNIGINL